MWCYNCRVPERSELLREVMRETRTTQSALSRLSGVRQPSISQFLSGTVDLSDDQLDRLLSCMGYRLEVSRRPVVPELTRSERRSWRLHCRLSIRLTPASLQEWRPVIERNLGRLRGSVTGQPHSRNLDRWESLVRNGDVLGLHRVLTGLDRDSIEMREVSPMGGLLPQDERQAALREGQADATMSVEIDILPIADDNSETERLGDLIEGVAGEFSPFEELHGFSIDGVDLSTSALPTGWRARLVKVQNANTAAPGGEPQYTGWCLDKEDLCVAKLCAFREKDQNFVAALVRSALVDRKTILTRLSAVDERYGPTAEMAASWLRSLQIGS